jgi:surface antigen
VTARPISQSDRQLVERATWMVNAMPTLGETPALPAVIEQPAPPAILSDDDAPSGVLIVVGDATSSMVAMRLAPPPRKKRHWATGAVILTLILAVSLTAIATVTPLAGGHAAGLAVNAAGPLGLPVALDSANKAPSGQWVAIIGLQPNQDVGGGAGPGVKAPGSAGLPVSSVKVVVNTGAPSTFEAGAVSPPPLSPWPPAWQYTAVPGYSAFGMGDTGGYYSWAFGQCTWWAQYERKDENLMHMGNAQFWASGASSRGYTVGSQPRVGATVVFQPGVQGAGGAGHVAHVVKVYPNDWVLISEMNFYWDGGGWGRVDYRFAHAGSGVQFIY